MYYWDKEVSLSVLKGKVIKEIKGLEKGSGEVWIFTECGQEYLFYHYQDCCEVVTLEDYDADVEDLVGAAILNAEEVQGGCCEVFGEIEL